tara:strand:+ start:608 stop:781 length:174 start_codon:yes stop_codon:yes gene_type:complete
MAQYLYEIVEFDTLSCGVCHKIMEEDATTDDYNFAWDNYVHTDCCSECSLKVLVKEQ